MQVQDLLSNLIIEPEFLSDQTCDFLIEYARNQEYQETKIFDHNKTNQLGHSSQVENKKIRDTQSVNVIPLQSLLKQILNNAVRDILNPRLGVCIDSSEVPQLLRYGVGGHYDSHSDAEGIFNNYGTLEWRKTVDRDVSIIIYLNDDFEGGNLSLTNLHLNIQPKKGMLVAFPSYHHYAHKVNPITKGERFALVTWATVR